MANRHDVIIWDASLYGTPHDFDEKMLQQARVLSRQEAKPSAKLLAFAREVESYSQNNDLDPIVLRYVQDFEKKVVNANTAAYCIELPEYQWRSLLKVLIEAAQTHGLVLCDEQLILLLLPDGSILPPHTARSWQDTLEELENDSGFPQTLMEFHRLMISKIGELLSEHSFMLDIDDSDESDIYLKYMRKTSSGLQKFGFHCQGGDGKFELKTYITIIEDNMIAICRKSDFQYAMNAGGGVYLDTPILLLKNTDKFQIINWEGFEDLLFKLKQSPLRWADAARDINGVDALFNGNVDDIVKNEVQNSLYMPYCLIVARLAGNPNFDELAVSLGTYGKDSGKFWGKFNHTTISAGWPKLVKYLREEVKPLD